MGEFEGAGGVGGAAGVDGAEPGEEVREADVGGVGGEAEFVVEVWAGGGGCEDLELGGVESESGDYVGADGGRGGGGQADDGDAGEGVPEVGEV